MILIFFLFVVWVDVTIFRVAFTKFSSNGRVSMKQNYRLINTQNYLLFSNIFCGAFNGIFVFGYG